MSSDPKTQLNKGLLQVPGSSPIGGITGVNTNIQGVPNSIVAAPKVSTFTQPVLKSSTQQPQANTLGFNTKIGGITAPSVGSQFSKPVGSEQTALQNFAPEVKQQIQTEIAPKQPEQQQQANTNPVSMDSKPEDFNEKEINFLRQAKSQGMDPQGALDFLNTKRTDEAGKFENLSTRGKIMYTPKDDADKANKPRWWKVINVGTPTRENMEKIGFTKEDTAASANFLGTLLPETLGNIGSFISKTAAGGIDTTTSLNIKKRGDKAKQEVYDAMGTKQGIGGFNEQAAGFMAQLLPTLLVPEGAIAELPLGLAEKAPFLAKLLENPTTRAVVKNIFSSEIGMQTFDITSQGRGMNPLEASLALIPGAFPIAGAGLRAVAPTMANRLMVSGIMNPARMGYITDKLQMEGVEGAEKATAESVGKVLLDNGVKGNKTQIVEQTSKLAKDNQSAVDGILGKSETLYKNETADNLLSDLSQEYKGGISNANKVKFDRVNELATKSAKEGLTLTELNEVKRMVRDLKPFTASGIVKRSMSDLASANSELKTFIEQNAEKSIEGLEPGTIKNLNNRTQFFMAVSDAVSRKELSNARAEVLNFFQGRSPGAIMGGIAGYEGGHGDWRTTLAGIILGGMTGSTKIKTTLANKIADMFDLKESTILQRFIENGGVGSLEPKLETKLNNMFDDMRQQYPSLPAPKATPVPEGGLPKLETAPTPANPTVKPGIIELPNKPKPLSPNPIDNAVSPSSSVSDVVPATDKGLVQPKVKETPVEKVPTKTPLKETIPQLKATVKAPEEITLYRGTGKSSPKEGNYYSTDKEFAREFTDLYSDAEIQTIKVKQSDIYKAKELPGASNIKEMDLTIAEAKKKGYKAILVDEGPNQPNSVHFIEKVKDGGLKPKVESKGLGVNKKK